MLEEFWGTESSEKVLHLHFVPLFSLQSRIQTALTRKFLQVRATEPGTSGLARKTYTMGASDKYS